jgi:hypothetical protein
VEQPLGSRYLLHELLGRGAMGQVFRGTVRGSGAAVAVKVLKPELISDTEVVARFFQERSILTSIDHPNVAKVLDLVVEGDTLGIVMELVEGQDLRRYLPACGTLPPAEAVRLVCQLLQGLAAVHAGGVVHRDVKPENVLVSTIRGQLSLKLTDFGVSRLSYGASLTKMTSLIGTPEYMAPELADHDSATPAADLYSAGIVLYEMLAGRTPFEGGHPLAVLRRQVEQPPPPIPGVPAELWAQLELLLAKDPRSRPGSAGEALDRLAPLQNRLDRLPALPPMPDQLPRTPGQATPGRESGQTVPGREAGRTVLRTRDRGLAPSEETGPAPNAPGRGGHGRVHARGRHRAAVLALPAALVILAAAVGVLLIRSPHPGSSVSPARSAATASYSFGPQRYQDGLVIARHWTLSGKDGSRLTETITASSATGRAARVKFEEPIPAAIASSVQSVQFRPAPSRIIRADPLVEWDLALPARGTIDIGYQATVGPAGAMRGRLAQWAKEFDALTVSLNLPRPVTIGVRSLGQHAVDPEGPAQRRPGRAPVAAGRRRVEHEQLGRRRCGHHGRRRRGPPRHGHGHRPTRDRPSVRSSDGHRNVEPGRRRQQLRGTWHVVFSGPGWRFLVAVPGRAWSVLPIPTVISADVMYARDRRGRGVRGRWQPDSRDNWQLLRRWECRVSSRYGVLRNH